MQCKEGNFLKVVSTVLGIRSTCSCARWEERGTSAVSRLADSRAVTLLGEIIIQFFEQKLIRELLFSMMGGMFDLSYLGFV
jgi:hypothetical protein